MEQTAENNLAISTVMDDWLDRKNPLQHSYRALLPDENCSFKWHIQKAEYDKDDVLNQFAGNLTTDGVSNQSIDLITGRQYIINMILDFLCMDVFEYPTDFKAYDYSRLQVDNFIKKCIDEMMNYNYESILAKDEDFANTFLGSVPRKYEWLTTLYVAHYPRPGIERMEIERTIGYLNEKKNCAVIVQFLLPNLSDDIIGYFREKLSNKYRVDSEYTSPNNYAYIDPDVNVDSHYRIVLQKTEYDSKPYYFLLYILRDKYTPKDEGENGNNPGELTTIDKIFPYEWQTFLRQDIDAVAEKLGNDFIKQTDSSLICSKPNDLVSQISILPDNESKVKSVMVMLINHDDEVDSQVTQYLKDNFYTTPIPNMYIDTPDTPSRTISVIFNGGVINYSVVP